jgi:hypothetical protein
MADDVHKTLQALDGMAQTKLALHRTGIARASRTPEPGRGSSRDHISDYERQSDAPRQRQHQRFRLVPAAACY